MSWEAQEFRYFSHLIIKLSFVVVKIFVPSRLIMNREHEYLNKIILSFILVSCIMRIPFYIYLHLLVECELLQLKAN